MIRLTLTQVAARIEDASRRVARLAMDRPRTILAAWLVATMLPLPGLVMLHRNTDGHALVPRHDPAVAIDHEVRSRFDLRDQLLVYVDTNQPDGIFDASLLGDVRMLTAEAAAVTGVGRMHVTSLATEVRDRLVPGSGATFTNFLQPPPVSTRELRDLADDLGRPPARLYTGTIVSRDRSATAVLVGTPNDPDVRDDVLTAVDRLAARLRQPNRHVDLVGAPAATALLADHILRDLAVLVPISMIVIAAIIWAGTRRAAPVAIALTKVGICIVWTFGVLGLLGIPIYLTITIVPVVLAAMSIADEIHLLTRYREALREHPSARDALGVTVDEIATPVVIATTTTCVGFLACAVTAIEPVRALGLACAIGIAYSLGFTLLVSPALLVLLPERFFRGSTPAGGAGTLARAGAVSTWCVQHRYATVTLIVAVSALALLGTRHVSIQDSWIDCFAPGSDFRLATERANESLNGVHVLHAHLRFAGGPRDALLRPEVLGALREFERFAHTGPTVGNVIGPIAQLDTVAAFWNVASWESDPATARRLIKRFDLAPGTTRRRRVVTDALDETVVTLFLKHANYRDTAQLMSGLRAFHDARLGPLGSDLRFAGDVAVSQAMIPAIVHGQVLSLPLALMGVFASVVLMLGSPALALAALVPVTASGVWVLGALGWLGVPLGVATSMFFSIAVGLGVDSHSIHLIARLRQHRRAGDPTPVLSSVRDVRTPVLVNTLAVASGFGLLMFSSVPANRDLGILVAWTLVLGCGLTLTGLAACLAFGDRMRTQTWTPLAATAELLASASFSRHAGEPVTEEKEV